MPQQASPDQPLRPAPWQPILTATQAARAHTALDEIAAALQPASNLAVNASLFGGAAGLAIFYTYLALANAGGNADASAMAWLETAIAGTADEKTQLSFFRGFPGVAWATTHLQDRIFAADEDPNTAIDEALATFLAGSPWPNLYDLVDGLVGLGVYALERLPNPCARQLLARIVDRLDATAERTAAGITWWTAPEVLFGQQRATCPHGYHNLGLAHGVPGVIALLGRIGQAGIAQAQVAALLAGAVQWLLAHKLPAAVDPILLSGWLKMQTMSQRNWLGVTAILALRSLCSRRPVVCTRPIGNARRSRSPQQPPGVRRLRCSYRMADFVTAQPALPIFLTGSIRPRRTHYFVRRRNFGLNKPCNFTNRGRV